MQVFRSRFVRGFVGVRRCRIRGIGRLCASSRARNTRLEHGPDVANVLSHRSIVALGRHAMGIRALKCYALSSYTAAALLAGCAGSPALNSTPDASGIRQVLSHHLTFHYTGKEQTFKVSDSVKPVSYTHLDVYKRQGHFQCLFRQPGCIGCNDLPSSSRWRRNPAGEKVSTRHRLPDAKPLRESLRYGQCDRR